MVIRYHVHRNHRLNSIRAKMQNDNEVLVCFYFFFIFIFIGVFGDFRYLFYYKRPTSELLPFDIEIEITLSKLKRVKVDIIRMEENNNYRYNEGHSDQNEILEMREPTFGDC